jgi:hypothetical protein
MSLKTLLTGSYLNPEAYFNTIILSTPLPLTFQERFLRIYHIPMRATYSTHFSWSIYSNNMGSRLKLMKHIIRSVATELARQNRELK